MGGVYEIDDALKLRRDLVSWEYLIVVGPS
jgi:hypothetical protein